jgi:HEAT repeat protein
VLEPIARALSDTDYFVREAARKALENIEEPQVRETLARASEDENSLVSQAAKKALENIEMRERDRSMLPANKRRHPTSRRRRQR